MNDIYSILERLVEVERQITPKKIKTEEKSSKQLPALFKPKLNTQGNSEHPAKNYFVGEDHDDMAEDVLTKVKRSLTDYLEQVKDKIEKTPTLDIDKDEEKIEPETLSPAVTPDLDAGKITTYPIKMVDMENGEVCEIHGDEHRGFNIHRGPHKMKSNFKDLAQVELALEMFNARLRKAAQNVDYIEEK